MSWTDIAAARRDAFSPITAEFLDDHGDNDEALMHRIQLIPVLWGRTFSDTQAGGTFFNGYNQTKGDVAITFLTTLSPNPQRIFVPEYADFLLWTGQAFISKLPGLDVTIGMKMVINDTDEGPAILVLFKNSAVEFSKIVTAEIDVRSHVNTTIDLRWKFSSQGAGGCGTDPGAPGIVNCFTGIFTGKVHGVDAPPDLSPTWLPGNVYKELYGFRWRHSNEPSEANADQGGINDP